MMMVHQGWRHWFIAAMARTPQRMVAVFSASRPTPKPGQSIRYTTGRWKVSRQVDEADHLLAGIGRPGRRQWKIGSRGQHRHRPAVQPREGGDDRAGRTTGPSRRRCRGRTACRSSGAPCRLGAGRAGSPTATSPRAGRPGRGSVHRRQRDAPRMAGRTGSAAPAAKASCLGLHRVVDATGAALDLPAAEFLLAQVLAEPGDHRRAGDEHRRGSSSSPSNAPPPAAPRRAPRPTPAPA